MYPLAKTLATSPPGYCSASTPGNSRVRMARARAASSDWDRLRSSGSENASRRKPVWGPTLGLMIAARAFCGVPMLAMTIWTLPFGSSRDRASPIAFNCWAASVSEMPGAKRT